MTMPARYAAPNIPSPANIVISPSDTVVGSCYGFSILQLREKSTIFCTSAAGVFCATYTINRISRHVYANFQNQPQGILHYETAEYSLFIFSSVLRESARILQVFVRRCAIFLAWQRVLQVAFAFYAGFSCKIASPKAEIMLPAPVVLRFQPFAGKKFR